MKKLKLFSLAFLAVLMVFNVACTPKDEEEDKEVCEAPAEELQIAGSFIDWGGKANATIDNKMVKESSCVWTKTFKVENDETGENGFKPSWVDNEAPAGSGANAAFKFRTGSKWGNESGAAGPDYGAKEGDPQFIALGKKVSVISNIKDGGSKNLWIKLEKGKTYKLSLNVKSLEVTFTEVK